MMVSGEVGGLGGGADIGHRGVGRALRRAMEHFAPNPILLILHSSIAHQPHHQTFERWQKARNLPRNLSKTLGVCKHVAPVARKIMPN